MDTAYKTRAWWMLRALDYGRLGDVYAPDRYVIWDHEAITAGENAVAPAGAECLTRIYVDRHGELLPQL